MSTVRYGIDPRSRSHGAFPDWILKDTRPWHIGVSSGENYYVLVLYVHTVAVPTYIRMYARLRHGAVRDKMVSSPVVLRLGLGDVMGGLIAVIGEGGDKNSMCGS